MGSKKSDLSWTSSASKWATQPGALAASVNRIINQVQKTPRGENRSLRVNRDRLAERLMQVWPEWIWYSSLDSEHRPAALRGRAQLFREVATQAEILKEQLMNGKSVERASESAVVRQLASKFPAVPDFTAFLVGLDYMIDAAEYLTQSYESAWAQFDRPSKEWLVAKILPPIFEDCFGRKAGISKTGPYIRFAAAVMVELGLKKYAEESIRRALTRPPRRKKPSEACARVIGGQRRLISTTCWPF